MYVVCEEASVDYKDAAEIVDNWPKLRKKAFKALKSYRETMK